MLNRFEKNLIALGERFPAAADAARHAPDCVELAPSESGAMTGRIGRIRLASRHDPGREAEVFIGAQGVEDGASAVVYGMGLGHHIPALLRAVGDGGRVVVAEANGAILRAALRVMGDERTLADPRLVIVAAQDEASFLVQLSAAIEGIGPGRTKVIIHEPSRKSIPEGFSGVINAVEMIRMERRFPVLMGAMEKKNFRENLPAALVSPGISSLRGVWKGAAVAVAGAGPSLDRDIAYLASLEGMVILSSDTALPALLGAGVEPDIVFTVDPQGASLLHFELAGRFDLPLVLTPAACSEVVRAWKGPLIFGFHNPSRYPAPAREWALKQGVFSAGGSVSLMAVETALLGGASAVIMFGQDFAWPGATAYARWTAPGILRLTPQGKGGAIVEKDWFGRDVTTSINLYSYARALENMAVRAAADIVTMSTGGMKLKGVPAVPSPFPYLVRGMGNPFTFLPKPPREPAEPAVMRAFEEWLDGA